MVVFWPLIQLTVTISVCLVYAYKATTVSIISIIRVQTFWKNLRYRKMHKKVRASRSVYYFNLKSNYLVSQRGLGHQVA